MLFCVGRTRARPRIFAGYAIVVRSTTAAFWDHQIFVGKVNEYTLAKLSIDDVVLGVKAIDKQGHESLVSPYVAAPFPARKIEVADQDPAPAPAAAR